MHEQKDLKAVWISSYPKSGNTWIHSVLRLAGRAHGFPQVDMDVYNLLRGQGSPSVCHAVSPAIGEGRFVVLKTHSPYKEGGNLHQLPGVGDRAAAFIHIYRNPLDVLLSYLNFTRLEYRVVEKKAAYAKLLFSEMLGMDRSFSPDEWFDTSLEDIARTHLDHALDAFSDSGLVIRSIEPMAGGWASHTFSWIDAAKAIPGISLRYEDCLVDPEQFVRLCDFFSFSREEVLQALRSINSRTETMKTAGDRNNEIFYNKMRAYYFRDFFSDAAIRRFGRKQEDALTKTGYLGITG